MNTSTRIAWAVALIAVDLLAVAVPLTAFVVAYALLVRPPWAKAFVEDVYRGPA